MQTRLGWLGWSALTATAWASACLPGSGPPLFDSKEDAGPPPAIGFGSTDAGARSDVDLGDPFAVTALQPSHGPWTGGTRATVSGRGFSSKFEAWIGATKLDPSNVFASTPTRAALVTPPNLPGPADVTLRNVATGQERTLVAGFTYDALVVSPSTGATTGGTRIVLRGNGTHWTGASKVAVGGRPCGAVASTDATNLSCTTPPGAIGSQDVTVTDPGGGLDQARDAFTYSDSPDGYRGGLFGGALSGRLTVLAFDALVGTPLAGGQAIAGSTLATAVTGTLDSSGSSILSALSLTGKVTVTVAAKCHQPMTFVDVPVDTVTAYLEPTLDPTCQGDPPSNGNWSGIQLGQIDGELVWSGGIEFQRAPWNNVPPSRGSQERRAAYVWTTTTHPLDAFQLPPATSATTTDSGGQFGYGYSLSAFPGNQTIYALAGLEDRSVDPPKFEPYAMGIARGVFVQPGFKTVGVDIPMTTILDHVVTTVPKPPVAGVRGPDRLLSTLAVNVGTGLFAILPQGTMTTFLPLGAANVSFLGVPSLDHTLAGSTYDLTAAAVSGKNQGLPRSEVTRIETTDANTPVVLGGFLSVPVLLQPPATGAWSGTHVALDPTVNAKSPVDLVVVSVSSGNGLVTWRIVAPGSDVSFDLPDLAAVPGVGKLVRGPVTTTFSVARIESFDYARLRWGQLSGNAWNAFAQDTSPGLY